MTPEEKQQLKELLEFKRQLEASASIPKDVYDSFRNRLGLRNLASLDGSTKLASTETQAVDEGGALSYSVAMPMNGFFEFVKGGTVYYIPYYTD